MGSAAMFGSIILSSSAAMLKLLLISIVGILCAKYPKNDPILPPVSLRYISRLSNIVLLPCLILKNLGGSVTLSLLGRIGGVTIFCFITNSISYWICDTIGFRIHTYGWSPDEILNERQSELFTIIKIASGNGNAIGLPVLVMQILCEDKLINKDFDNDPGQCYDEASSIIFVYMIAWFIMFWGYAFPTFQRLKHQQTAPDVHNSSNANNRVDNLVYHMTQCIYNAEYQHHVYLTIKKIVLNPAIIAVMVSLFIGFIPPLQYHLFASNGHLKVIGSSIDTIGQSVLALNILIMSASLAQCDFPVDKFRYYIDTFLFADAVPSPIEIEDAEAPKLTNKKEQKEEEELMMLSVHSGTMTDPATFIAGNDHGLDVEIILEEEEKRELRLEETEPVAMMPERGNPPLQTVLALIVSRLLLPPLVMLTLNAIFLGMRLIDPSQRLMLLIILLESCSPPAQVLIVALNQLGIASAASRLSYMYVFLYGASILTVTMWTAVAMSVYY